ncbi:hypothetical protein [Agrobacterium sp. CG674]
MMTEKTSVGGLVRAAEDRIVAEKAHAARTPSLSVVQIRSSLKDMIRSKIWWIDKFSEGRAKRPDHEITSARKQLAALVQADDLLKGEHSAADRGG